MSRPYYMPSVEEMISCGLVDPHQEMEERPEPPKGYIYMGLWEYQKKKMTMRIMVGN